MPAYPNSWQLPFWASPLTFCPLSHRPLLWACFPAPTAHFSRLVILEKISESALDLRHRTHPPTLLAAFNPHFVVAPGGGGRFTKGMRGLGGMGTACFERVHSWRKLKLEKAALLPAIQPQLAGVCLHKDSSANNLWSVSGGM